MSRNNEKQKKNNCVVSCIKNIKMCKFVYVNKKRNHVTHYTQSHACLRKQTSNQKEKTKHEQPVIDTQNYMYTLQLLWIN